MESHGSSNQADQTAEKLKGYINSIIKTEIVKVVYETFPKSMQMLSAEYEKKKSEIDQLPDDKFSKREKAEFHALMKPYMELATLNKLPDFFKPFTAQPAVDQSIDDLINVLNQYADVLMGETEDKDQKKDAHNWLTQLYEQLKIATIYQDRAIELFTKLQSLDQDEPKKFKDLTEIAIGMKKEQGDEIGNAVYRPYQLSTRIPMPLKPTENIIKKLTAYKVLYPDKEAIIDQCIEKLTLANQKIEETAKGINETLRPKQVFGACLQIREKIHLISDKRKNFSGYLTDLLSSVEKNPSAHNPDHLKNILKVGIDLDSKGCDRAQLIAELSSVRSTIILHAQPNIDPPLIFLLADINATFAVQFSHDKHNAERELLEIILQKIQKETKLDANKMKKLEKFKQDLPAAKKGNNAAALIQQLKMDMDFEVKTEAKETKNEAKESKQGELKQTVPATQAERSQQRQQLYSDYVREVALNRNFNDYQRSIQTVKNIDEELALVNQSKEFLRKYQRLYTNAGDDKEEYKDLKDELERRSMQYHANTELRNGIIKENKLPDIKSKEKQLLQSGEKVRAQLQNQYDVIHDKLLQELQTLKSLNWDVDLNDNKFSEDKSTLEKILGLYKQLTDPVNTSPETYRIISSIKVNLDKLKQKYQEDLPKKISEILNLWHEKDQIKATLASIQKIQMGITETSSQLQTMAENLSKKEVPKRLVDATSLLSKKSKKLGPTKKGLVEYYLLKTEESIIKGKPTRKYLDMIYGNPRLSTFLTLHKNYKKRADESREKLITHTAQLLKEGAIKALQETDPNYFNLDLAVRKNFLKSKPLIQCIDYADKLTYHVRRDILTTNPLQMADAIEFWMRVAEYAKTNHDQFTFHTVMGALMENEISNLFAKTEDNIIVINSSLKELYNLYKKDVSGNLDAYKTELKEWSSDSHVLGIPHPVVFNYNVDKIGEKGGLRSPHNDVIESFSAVLSKAIITPTTSSGLVDDISKAVISKDELSYLAKQVHQLKFDVRQKYEIYQAEHKNAETSIAASIDALNPLLDAKETVRDGIHIYFVNDDPSIKLAALPKAENALIFNQQQKKFIYALSNADTDSRWIGRGQFVDAPTFKSTITQSNVETGAILPRRDLKEDKTTAFDCDFFAATYQHLLDLIKQQADLRQHGRKDIDKDKAMEIDIHFSALSSNADQSQAKRLAYLNLAIQALDGAKLPFTLGDKKIDVSVRASLSHTMTIPHDKKMDSMLKYENRKAHIYLTDAIRAKRIPEIKELKDIIQTLSYFNSDNPAAQDIHYLSLKSQLLEETKKLNELMTRYPRQLDKSQLHADIIACREEIDSINKKITGFEKDISSHQSRIWSKNKKHIEGSLAQLRSEIKPQSLTEDQMKTINILVLKAQIDELYYTGADQDPKNAIVLCACQMALQRLLGISTNVGFESPKNHTQSIQQLLTMIESSDPKALVPDLPTLQTKAGVIMQVIEKETASASIVQPAPKERKESLAHISNKKVDIQETLKSMAMVMAMFATQPPSDIKLFNVERFVVPKDKNPLNLNTIHEVKARDIVTEYQAKADFTRGLAVDCITQGKARGSCFSEQFSPYGGVDITLDYYPETSKNRDAYLETACAMIQTYIDDCKSLGKPIEPIYIREVDPDNEIGIAVSKALIDICVASKLKFQDENNFKDDSGLQSYIPKVVKREYQIQKPAVDKNLNNEVRLWCESFFRSQIAKTGEVIVQADQTHVVKRLEDAKQSIGFFQTDRSRLTPETLKALGEVSDLINNYTKNTPT